MKLTDKEQKLLKLNKTIAKLQKKLSILEDKRIALSHTLFELKYEKVGIELDGIRCGCSYSLCRGDLDGCFGYDM